MRGVIKRTYSTAKAKDVYRDRDIHRRINTNVDRIESVVITLIGVVAVFVIQSGVILWLMVR